MQDRTQTLPSKCQLALIWTKDWHLFLTGGQDCHGVDITYQVPDMNEVIDKFRSNNVDLADEAFYHDS